MSKFMCSSDGLVVTSGMSCHVFSWVAFPGFGPPEHVHLVDHPYNSFTALYFDCEEVPFGSDNIGEILFVANTIRQDIVRSMTPNFLFECLI